MKAFSTFVIFAAISAGVVDGAQNLDAIHRMEASGDVTSARAALARDAEEHPNDVASLTEYAEFLDRYGDPQAAEAYGKLLAILRRSGDQTRAATIARRLAVLDLLAGKREAATSDLQSANVRSMGLETTGSKEAQPTVPIPGPLRSFARMAALSPDANPEDILPSLARNVVTNGYEATSGSEGLEQTEYLKLVHRYLSQARELQKLAGDSQAIKLENCESPNGAELLRILGFRIRGGCGSELVLETVNATRAFLTTDSGFPVNELEQALRTNKPFSYDYHSTQVPVLYNSGFWLGMDKDKSAADFIETFISDPSTCRLYLGLSKLDRATGEQISKAITLTRLKAFSHILDFYGGMFEIRGGKAVTPGGQRVTSGWGDLVGVSPDQGVTFFDRLMAKDDGWMASLYDALARIHGPVQEYLTEPARLKRLYLALRGRVTSPGPARPVFRSNTDMMLLTTRLWIEPNTGKPHIPGSLEVWKNLFLVHPNGKYDGKLTRSAASWKDSDDLLEALFALCRKTVENEPLKIFMALSDLDRNRPKPLEPATVDRLTRSYRQYGSQFPIFAESPNLTDKSIGQFLDAADAISKTRDPALRSDTAGTFQALIGVWQIFARQGSIPQGRADSVFSSITMPFAAIHNGRELFDAGSGGVNLLLTATGSKPGNQPHEALLDLLAGAAEPGHAEAHTQVVEEMIRIMEAQRIVSLDLLFDFAAQLDRLAHGENPNAAVVNRVAASIGEIPLPQSSLSTAERTVLAFGYWTEKHIDTERRLNLRAAVEKAGHDPEKLKEVRGLMVPLLRDTLLAYNYAHYAPPGAQVLFTNPMFVRSHDFQGAQNANATWRATEVYGSGWPSNGGGRLVGSLSSLPYALAEAEQNFLIPAQTQALIWGDLVPQMILSAKVPRWWNVTPSQIHWVGLHLRYGRELLAESTFDTELRAQVLENLSMVAAPGRTREIELLLEQGNAPAAVDKVTPAELFMLARSLSVARQDDPSCLAADLRRLAQQSPNEINYAAISRAFGTPKPTLANSYEPQLLNLQIFPALMGYSSRILAESWESNTLYWAALADEVHVTPAELNLRIPEWTRELVERIFASHLEDWPAVLKSLRQVGDDVRARSRAAIALEQKTVLQAGPSAAASAP